jgi:hypothetical protein
MPKSNKQKAAPMQMDDIDAMLESAIAHLASISGRSTPYTDYQDAMSALDRLNEIKRVRSGKPFVDDKGFNKQAKELLKWLNGLERKPRSPGLTLADLCDRHEAVGLMDGEKDLHGWQEDAVFIRAESLCRFIRTLTPDGYEWLTTPEKIMGWFEEQNDDECDAENEFMSTPCWVDELESGDEDEYENIDSDIDHCARGGLLLIR